jgi:Sporulation and spore germination
MRTLGHRVGAGVLILSLVAACGVPADRGVRNIPLPNGRLAALMATTTSTSTTSTTTTTTIAPPPSTVPPTEPPPTEPLTTVADTTVDYFSLYFVVGDRFIEERRLLGAESSLQDVVNAVAEGPSSTQNPVFSRSALRADDVRLVTRLGGLATVQLDSKVRDLPAAEQKRLIGQLVLTLTAQRGVGQVKFTIDSVEFVVPRGDGTFAAEPLSNDDYAGSVFVPSDTVPSSPDATLTTLPPTVLTDGPVSSPT